MMGENGTVSGANTGPLLLGGEHPMREEIEAPFEHYYEGRARPRVDSTARFAGANKPPNGARGNAGTGARSCSPCSRLKKPRGCFR